MKKEFILSIRISVDVNEKIRGKGKPKMLGYMQQLLDAFLKDEKAVLEYFKFYFPDLLLHGNCYDYLLELLKAKDVSEIVSGLELSGKLTSGALDFIETIYSTDADKHIKDEVCVRNHDLFTDQLSVPVITGVEFKGID